MGAFNQRFEALFPPRWSPGLCGLLRSPAIPPGLSMRECGAVESASYSTACPVHSTICHFSGSASHCIAMRPLHPGCPSLPLLQVWMNVSSYVLGCWTSMPFDFLSVPVWFLFLNCCCPPFGCARRHSVSTYASILSGSLSSSCSWLTNNVANCCPEMHYWCSWLQYLWQVMSIILQWILNALCKLFSDLLIWNN